MRIVYWRDLVAGGKMSWQYSVANRGIARRQNLVTYGGNSPPGKPT